MIKTYLVGHLLLTLVGLPKILKSFGHHLPNKVSRPSSSNVLPREVRQNMKRQGVCEKTKEDEIPEVNRKD